MNEDSEQIPAIVLLPIAKQNNKLSENLHKQYDTDSLLQQIRMTTVEYTDVFTVIKLLNKSNEIAKSLIDNNFQDTFDAVPVKEIVDFSSKEMSNKPEVYHMAETDYKNDFDNFDENCKNPSRLGLRNLDSLPRHTKRHFIHALRDCNCFIQLQQSSSAIRILCMDGIEHLPKMRNAADKLLLGSQLAEISVSMPEIEKKFSVYPTDLFRDHNLRKLATINHVKYKEVISLSELIDLTVVV